MPITINENLLEQKILKNIGFIIKEDLSPCPKCERFIQSRVVYLKGYSFITKHCNYCNDYFEKLLCKGYFEYDGLPVVNSWPRLRDDIEDKKLSPENIVNFQNIPGFILHLTNECNADCAICNVKDNNRNSRFDIEEIKNFLKAHKGKTVVLCGGEPTIIPNLTEIIKIILKSGNSPELQTNGIRLSDNAYLKQLKAAGIKHIYLSFDGFEEDIYARLRNDKKQLHYKLQALQNLEKEKIMTSFSTVIAEGINEGQIPSIVKYAAEKSFIYSIRFVPLYLDREIKDNNLSKKNMISKKKLREAIALSGFHISPEYFNLWTELKYYLAHSINQKFNFLPIPVFQKNAMYFKRRDSQLLPLIDNNDLKRWRDEIKSGKTRLSSGKKIMKELLLGTLKTGFKYKSFDYNLYNNNIVQVIIADIGSHCNFIRSYRTPIMRYTYARAGALTSIKVEPPLVLPE